MATMSWLLGLATQRPLNRSTSRGVMGGEARWVILREAGGETWMITEQIQSTLSSSPGEGSWGVAVAGGGGVRGVGSRWQENSLFIDGWKGSDDARAGKDELVEWRGLPEWCP